MRPELSSELASAVEAHRAATHAREEQRQSMMRDIESGRESTPDQQEHFMRLDRRMRETRQRAFDVFAREHLDLK